MNISERYINRRSRGVEISDTSSSRSPSSCTPQFNASTAYPRSYPPCFSLLQLALPLPHSSSRQTPRRISACPISECNSIFCGRMADSDFRNNGRAPRSSTKAVEYAFLNFDLDADLSSLFNWNTKQVFAYLVADYKTAKYVRCLQCWYEDLTIRNQIL